MWKGCEEKPLRGRITVVLEVGNFIQTLNISPPFKTLWLNCIDLIVCPFLEWCFKCTANLYELIREEDELNLKECWKDFQCLGQPKPELFDILARFHQTSVLLSVLAVFICTVTVSVNNNQLITFWTGKKGKRNRWLDKDWTKDWTLIQTYLLRGGAAGGVRWRHTGVRLMRGGGANEGGVVQVWRENRQREEAEEWHMTHEDVNFKIKEEIIKPNHKIMTDVTFDWIWYIDQKHRTFCVFSRL